MAPDGSLWIAKFPSRHDDHDVGAWEMVVHDLAVLCGLRVPEAKAERFSKLGTTFLVKRFDRDGAQRIHFSSAMSMLGKKDGADATDGSSYLEIVSFLRAYGAAPQKDLLELWKRIVFGMAVGNTDDHFRNHGFLLSGEGWCLSPMYDVNPDIYGEYLSLNVDDRHAAIDLDVAAAAAPYYGVTAAQADSYIEKARTLIRDHWRPLAGRHGIGRSEIERMEAAFRACEG